MNVLDPTINHSKWTEEELELLFKAHAELGNKWSAIAMRIPGRCVCRCSTMACHALLTLHVHTRVLALQA